jgi:MFS superfamily sulfate permease-like transporter
MDILKRHARYYFLAFLKHDFKASITVFFVALPLCLGISLASGAPLYAGLISGIIGGIIVGLISKSHLSVSGPAAGLTAISAGAITELGSLQIFFLSVAVAGVIQLLLGVFKLGGFTHFIPSAVIKGMLAGIGIILIAKQIPLMLGYDEASFWTKNCLISSRLKMHSVMQRIFIIILRKAPIVIAIASLALLIAWKKTMAKRVPFIPTSFLVVVFGTLLAFLFQQFIPSLALKPQQFVSLPSNLFSDIKLPDYRSIFSNTDIIKNAVVICIVATLETLLSVEAIDKIDLYNRITPQNRELVAQGTGNIISGILGGLPITAVIVRSSANAEADARTKLSAIFHGIWLLVLVFLRCFYAEYDPLLCARCYLIRTGYNLAKPRMIVAVYKLGREQFIPFIVTIIAMLFTDLLVGVGIGIAYSCYFIFKNTYKAGYTLETKTEGHITALLF